jgi:hypothetical protein
MDLSADLFSELVAQIDLNEVDHDPM